MPVPHPLHHIFDHTAHDHPHRIALDIPPGITRPTRTLVTYAELNRRADAIASRLRRLVRPDAVVAVLLPRDTPALYASQLGVQKAGGAFTCLDPGFPDAHMRAVLDDAAPVAVLTDAPGRARLEALGVEADRIIDAHDNAEPTSLDLPDGEQHDAVDPVDLAYLIYTSGTTGRPKGVMIEHAGIVNLVQSDVEYFGLTPDDRVAQCSSPAYDSSIEEAWLAFGVGATLVLLDDETVRLGPDLVHWLAAERITVLCPPPTLLRSTHCADPAAALPDLRLLYVGGEALGQDLADRWGAGVWLENGYGPTECTVTVLRGRVRPGRAVTIGRPIPGHRAWVLDEALEEVEPGEAGELCIAGVGLARGYHNQPAVTAEKFPVHPRFGRIYRTGDLVRRRVEDGEGDVEYLGRIDGQVKLRGYRIELGAVEACLAALPGIHAAACRIQGMGAEQLLAAFVVLEETSEAGSAPDGDGDAIDFDALRSSLRQVLPHYMVPTRFATIAALPTTVGGKLDRAALPELTASTADNAPAGTPPRDDLERIVAAAFAKGLGITGDGWVSVDADFFLDLGGDSLSAVGVVVALREVLDGTPGRALTVRDVYELRTAAALSQKLREGEEDAHAPARSADSDSVDGARWHARTGPLPGASPVAATIVQSAWLLLLLLAASVTAYGAAFWIFPQLVSALGLLPVLLLAPVLALLAMLAYAPLSVAATVLVKRLLIGRYAPLRTPVWGGFYVRHWIVMQTARLIPWALVEGTVFQCAILNALGARIGQRVHIHRGVDLRRGGWDLLTIGDDVTLCQDVSLQLVDLDAGHLVVGPITIGAGATLDTRAGLGPGAVVEPGGYLTALSWLAGGGRIPAGEAWDGVPAERIGDAPPAPAVDTSRDLSPFWHGCVMVGMRCLQWLVAGALWSAVVGGAVVMAPDAVTGGAVLWAPEVVAGGAPVTWTFVVGWTVQFLPFIAVALLVVPLTLLLEALLLRLAGPIPSGAISRWGLPALRVWWKTGVVDAAGRWLSGSLFWPWWLRLAGMRIGRGCEISTIIDVLPETVAIGDESFFADGIYFCAPRRHRGTVTVAATELGRNTFLGNHAVIPAGHRWPDDLFVGVATAADPVLARQGTGWFGHPPMELPRREVVAADRRLTHDPDLVRIVTRLFWELLRFLLPILPLCLVLGWYEVVGLVAGWQATAALGPGTGPLGLQRGLGLLGPLLGVIAVATAATFAALLIPVLAVLALKWLLLGRVAPGQHAFWSCWCGRWDFLYVAWGFWAGGTLAWLDGTLLLNAVLRLTGMRIGRRVALGGGFAQVVDPDMLHFEDDATVTCQFQAHSFEDRVLKIDHLHIRAGATVGRNTVVFYGADIGAGAKVAPHGVVMKRDVLQGGRGYGGCPVQLRIEATDTRMVTERARSLRAPSHGF